jgi:hypothetical protein
MKMGCVGALLVAVLAALAVPTRSAGASGVPPHLSEAESETLARTGVGSKMAALVPPPGSVSSVTEPAGDNGLLADRAVYVARNVVKVDAWWVAPGTPGQVVEWIRAHPPPEALVHYLGVPEDCPACSVSIEFEWPDVPRARGPITLQVLALPLARGETGIRVTAVGFWITPRPVTEVIPGGARLLRITARATTRDTRVSQRPVTITDPARIEHVISLLNSLPRAQPVGVPGTCAPFPGALLRLAFYRDPDARAVAVVRDNIESCGDVQLEIGVREEPPLEGGELASQISDAIGVKLHLTPVRTQRSRRQPGMKAGVRV